ncbi:MAG TPA: BrnT family toxin [Azospirillum sp.]
MPPKYSHFISRFGDDDFEWDSHKSLVNLHDRDVAFTAAQIVFRGRLLRRPDSRANYGEARWQVLGELHGRVVAIIYTQRGRKCRIISVRRATPEETEIYYGG